MIELIVETAIWASVALSGIGMAINRYRDSVADFRAILSRPSNGRSIIVARSRMRTASVRLMTKSLMLVGVLSVAIRWRERSDAHRLAAWLATLANILMTIEHLVDAQDRELLRHLPWQTRSGDKDKTP